MSALSSASDRGGFPPTHWSVVLAAGHGSATHADEALAELCRTYWYPLYAFARRSGRSPEDAQDLTQGFFAHLLETELVASADASRGRFRSYLLQSFRHFMSDDRARGMRQKRGGGLPNVSLDAAGVEAQFGREVWDRQNPEFLYERNCALAMLQEAMLQMEREFAASGREQVFNVLRPRLQGDDHELSYAAAARELSTSEGVVRVMVHRLRKRYRELLNGVVLRTVSSPTDVEEELRYLLQVVQG